MSGGSTDDEVRRLLDDLAAMRLPVSEWTGIEDALHRIDPGAPGVDARISQVVFEARVHRRFHGGRAASTLPPTKRTSSLPWVGLVCGALLLAVGGALGGGPVLVGVALLGLFVFGIAMAGSRVTHARLADRSTEPTEPVVPMPPSTAAVVDALRP
jgi:hypothetical protein